MPTKITINDDQGRTLSINTENEISELVKDGKRTLYVKGPYTIEPPLPDNKGNFNNADVYIIKQYQQCHANPAVVIEHPEMQQVEIVLK